MEEFGKEAKQEAAAPILLCKSYLRSFLPAPILQHCKDGFTLIPQCISIMKEVSYHLNLIQFGNFKYNTAYANSHGHNIWSLKINLKRIEPKDGLCCTT